MTFLELVSRVQKRTSQFSTVAATRIGETVNDIYKRVTSAVGIDFTSRRVLAQEDATIGSQLMTFDDVEKVVSVYDASGGYKRFLDEVSLEELDRHAIADSDTPTKYALYRMNAGSVQIKLNVNPQTAFTLYAPAYERADTLAGSQEPAFPESFHDIIYHGVLKYEYLHLEKPVLSKAAELDYEDRLGDLRLFIAKSPQQDIYQGKMSASISGSMVPTGGGAGGSVDGTASYTQTGLITFDRTGAALLSRYPFAVAVGSEKVANLDADLLDGQEGTYYTNASNLASGTVPIARFSGITNAQIDAAAAIAYSKLNLATSIANADVNAAAAIAWTKISKTGSSLADFTTRSAADLSSGTIPQARHDGNRFLAADGTVSLPGLSFTNETDCGVYKEGTNAIAVATNGVKAIGIDSTQFIDSPTQPRCSALSAAASQSLNDSTWTGVNFNSEDFDVSTMHDNASNKSRFTIPTGGDGLYLVGGAVTFDANATGQRGVRVAKNGTAIAGTGEVRNTAGAGVTVTSTTHLVSLVAGDYVELQAYQSSGGALNISNTDVSRGWVVKLW